MKRIFQYWVFRSSSGSRLYQTIQWSDSSLSCDCPGWTQRNPPGGRTCKHVRLVPLGLADEVAERWGTDKPAAGEEAWAEAKSKQMKGKMAPAKPEPSAKVTAKVTPGRAFDFE